MGAGFQPRRGCVGFLHSRFTCAAPGWRNPFGVEVACHFPRVAAKARQPWALGRNRLRLRGLIKLSLRLGKPLITGVASGHANWFADACIARVGKFVLVRPHKPSDLR